MFIQRGYVAKRRVKRLPVGIRPQAGGISEYARMLRSVRCMDASRPVFVRGSDCMMARGRNYLSIFANLRNMSVPASSTA